MSALSARRSLALASVLTLCAPLPAGAHIKWFANVDVQGDPLVPWQVMGSASFMALGLLAVVVLAAAGAADGWLARAAAGRGRLAALRGLDLGEQAFALMRLGIAGCFMASFFYFRAAPVLLTPELKTHASWVGLLQWTIALAALLERPRVAAAGIAVLLVAAVARFGVFHLLDYPLFAGIAAMLYLGGKGGAARSRALVALRVTVALTFLWGGVEKWLYPEWTYPLLCGSGKALLMGLPPDVFMQCAGFVEFCLAFVVLVGDLAARVAALALVGVFIAAIPMFGAIDAVGHAPFMLALLVLAMQPNRLAARFAHARCASQGARWGLAFAGVLAVLPSSYFAAHQLAYGRGRAAEGALVAALLAGAVLLKRPVLRVLRRAASGRSAASRAPA
jgi:hypothetical protein